MSVCVCTLLWRSHELLLVNPLWFVFEQLVCFIDVCAVSYVLLAVSVGELPCLAPIICKFNICPF